jgi:hypothetical protein
VITEVAEDDDGTQTYEQYLAAKEALRVAEDAERSVRPVEIDESQFQKVKPLVREGDDEKAAAEAEAAERAAARKAAKKQRSDSIIVSVTHSNRKSQSLVFRARAISSRPLPLQLLIGACANVIFCCSSCFVTIAAAQNLDEFRGGREVRVAACARRSARNALTHGSHSTPPESHCLSCDFFSRFSSLLGARRRCSPCVADLTAGRRQVPPAVGRESRRI